MSAEYNDWPFEIAPSTTAKLNTKVTLRTPMTPEQREAKTLASWQEWRDEFLSERDRVIKLETKLLDIVRCYEARSELYTNDAECAETLAVKAGYKPAKP